MVSKRRLDYGFNGYRPPIIPKAPRSVRRRGPHKDLAKDSKLCAFDLLAAIAGKLLQESESFVSSNVPAGNKQPRVCPDQNEKQHLVGDKALGSESSEHGSCAESVFVPEGSIQEDNRLSSSKKLLLEENDSVPEPVPVSVSPISDAGKKVDHDIKLEAREVKNGDGKAISEGGSSFCIGDSLNDGESRLATILPIKNSSEEECVNTDMLINSENSVRLPMYRDPIPDSLQQKSCNNIKVGIRDDDDNLFRCNEYSTEIRYFRHQPRLGQRRVRKMLTSKYWKIASKTKHCRLYTTGEGMRSFYQHRKRVYTVEGCQQASVKKRKLIGQSFTVPNDQDATIGNISNLPEKGTGIDKISLKRGNGALATSIRHQKAKDCHVKFCIKSFKVPELYVELPENASVGSLKRTVMEAVTAILSSGIRVGVVLQGKKVGDDDKTLQQAGISPSSKLDTLGFMLEPSVTHASASTTNTFPSVQQSGTDQQLLRSPSTSKIVSGISPASVDPPLAIKFDDDMENSEFVSSQNTPSKEIMDGEVSDSMALVPVGDAEALPDGPLNSKPKRNELSQRRTRRPFSVSEVEALVEAVERLGTGRWRDVKIGAFENADHRTYVDLKDKWKTLVHTASISPQQRRGEPVPQELLDRVLSAHSYWSSKQYSKQHPIEPVKTEAVSA